MSKRTAYLISCSDHYSHRLWMIDRHLKSRGYKTVYLTSDFDHTAKKPFCCAVPGCVQFHVLPYHRNLSVQRIVSHWQFARKVFRYLEKLDTEPDVVLGLLPPNFLAHYLARYKKRHPSVRLIFDVFDLWPETFPSEGAKKLLSPAFSVWAKLRDKSLPAADFITTECGLFQEKLRLSEENSAVVYLCAEELAEKRKEPVLAEDRWDLCYLGAINNVIGISEICRLVGQLNQQRAVTLHIIGSGERLAELEERIRETGAEVICHGPVYDDDRKQEIIRSCHFGLNIVRASACIGLTMKSVDYFRHGLPVISNVPADTQLLVEKHGVGIQLNEQCAEMMAHLSIDDCMKMRENVRKTFTDVFSEKVIEAQYQKLFDSWL